MVLVIQFYKIDALLHTVFNIHLYTIYYCSTLGFAIGSLIGGLLYKIFGGVTTLRIFSLAAIVTAFMYLILHLMFLKDNTPGIIIICVYMGAMNCLESLIILYIFRLLNTLIKYFLHLQIRKAM